MGISVIFNYIYCSITWLRVVVFILQCMAVRKLLGTVDSRSQSHNQKHRMIQSIENQTNRVGSRMLIFLLDSVTYSTL